MATYISFLRGINVAGKNLIKMDLLRSIYVNIGFSGIKTYLQSGNVVFCSNEKFPERISEKISAQIKHDFGMDVHVLVLTPAKLEKVVSENPFLNDSQINPDFLHVTFLGSFPVKYDIEMIKEKLQGDEKIEILGDVVYLYCPFGYGSTRLSNSFIEARLKITATTRNWKTTLELLRISKEMRS
jgi:uncharacterized protein (DUF1697 family)